MKYILALLLFIPFASFAQDRGFYSEGREFFLGHLYPSFADASLSGQGGIKFYAVISSDQETRISLSYYDASGKEVEAITAKLSPSISNQFELALSEMKSERPDGDAAEYKACHITSDKPVTVSYFCDGPGSWGSYLALPVSAWGKKYVVASYNDNPGNGLGEWAIGRTDVEEVKKTCGYFTIIGGYNGTVVTITPTARTRGGAVGVKFGPGADGTPKPYTISLNKGQCYFVKSASALTDGTDDISGTIVTADKPVAVISGHQMAAVGDGLTEGPSNFGISDSRDFIIEQLIPVEYWDNKGYCSVPMFEAKGAATYGIGENYRIYVSDNDVPTSVNAFNTGEIPEVFHPTPYGSPVELSNRTKPLSFSTDDSGARFSVVQYELRSQTENSRFAAPNMTVITPSSQWKRAFRLQGYPSERYTIDNWIWRNYITIISTHDHSKITVFRNSSQPAPLSNTLTATKSWSPLMMPYGNSFYAATYSITIKDILGFKSDYPFMIYQLGSYGRDFDGDFPGDGIDDFWGSDSHPAGMQLYNRFVNKSLKVTVDTLCNGWHICANDLNAEGGIRFITLIDDPNGYLYYGKNYESSNCSFEIETDPLGLHQFTIGEDKANVCFTIHSNSPDQAVYAPIAIYDKAGNCEILELHMEPRKITVTPNDTKFLFTKTLVSKERCETFTIRNLPANSEPMFVNTVSTVSPYFTVKSVTPPVPCAIVPGDSLRMEVCFTSSDNVNHVDRLKVSADCNTIDLPLQAQALTPVISALDLAFGTVNQGITACKDVEVSNTGLIEFTVTGVVLEESRKFSLDTSNLNLPWLIQPGAKRKVRVCYKSDSDESDTVRLTWQTDILPPYSVQNKDNSIITANGEGHVSVLQTRRRSLEVSISRQPTHEYVDLSITSPESGKLSVKIYDVLGKEVNSGITRFIDEGSSKVRMNVADLLKGTYIIVTSVDGMMETFRVIVD